MNFDYPVQRGGTPGGLQHRMKVPNYAVPAPEVGQEWTFPEIARTLVARTVEVVGDTCTVQYTDK